LDQQLIALPKAKDAGAISDAEYQSQKAKLLGKEQSGPDCLLSSA
jgi:hypothetical protein